MKTLNKIVLTGLLFSPIIAFTQINYDFHLSYGYSNLKEINKEYSVKLGNYYTKLPSYSFGCGIYYPIKETKFQILSGIDFLSLAAKNHMPKDFINPSYTGPLSWEERFYSLTIPLNLSYKFEKWVFLNGGFVNIIHLNKPENMYDKRINHYIIGFLGSINFLIIKRLIIGVNYYRDIIPTAKLLQLPSTTNTYKIFFSFEQISIKIGYMTNKEE